MSQDPKLSWIRSKSIKTKSNPWIEVLVFIHATDLEFLQHVLKWSVYREWRNGMSAGKFSPWLLFCLRHLSDACLFHRKTLFCHSSSGTQTPRSRRSLTSPASSFPATLRALQAFQFTDLSFQSLLKVFFGELLSNFNIAENLHFYISTNGMGRGDGQ